MKKIYLLLCAGMASLCLQSQTKRCATMDVFKENLKKNHSESTFYTAEKKASEWLENNKQFLTAKKQQVIIKIPVVVHVLYKNAAQNIPDSNIISQIAVLNECFRKLNANYSNTRPVFDSIGADVEIEFCLADKDPQGNTTTGIIRKSAPTSIIFNVLQENMKSPALGGDTLWPSNQYLNIWACDMSIFGNEFLLGYAQFPGMDPQTDGVVIQYNYIGRNSKPKFSGRTTVHEVGHWLGMRHIWADEQPGSCDSTDFVGDTPNCLSQSSSDCNTTKNSCSNEDPYWVTMDPPDMVENYMDYSKDSCMTMFTKGQKLRMYSFLNTDPDRLAITTSTAGCNTYAAINEVDDFDSHVKVYPNPASGLIKISLTGLAHSDFNYELYSSVGKLIRRDRINYLTADINSDGLANGIYFLKVFNGANTATKRVVINR